VQYRSFDIRTVLETYAGIQAGQTYPVFQIIPDMNDYEVFEARASNVGRHYDPLLAGHSFLPQVHEGSVYDVSDGFFNFSDPSGYVFPAENHSELFARIPASEPQVLEDFLHRRRSDWKLPLIQIILDWAAGLTFILLFLAAGLYGWRKRSNMKTAKNAKEVS
jgi:hypothetical protein